MRRHPVRPFGRAAARRVLVPALVSSVLAAAIASGCVDGVTPDCSDPKTQCGPSLDGSPEHVEAALPEAAPPVTDGAAFADADAEPDADLDAGDGG